MARHRVEIVAWWFPTKLDANAQKILDVIARHKIHPQLWVTGAGASTTNDAEQQARVTTEAARIRPIAEAHAGPYSTVVRPHPANRVRAEFTRLRHRPQTVPPTGRPPRRLVRPQARLASSKISYRNVKPGNLGCPVNLAGMGDVTGVTVRSDWLDLP